MKNHHFDLLKVIKPTLVVVLFFIGLSANAQSRFGVKTSINHVFAKEATILHSSDNISYTHQVDFLSQSSAKSLGLFYKKNFNFLFVEADVMYSTYKSQYRILDLLDTEPGINNPPQTGGPGPFEGKTYTESYANMDLSLVAGYRHKNFDIGVGPVFHRTISLDSQLSQLSNYTETRKFIDPGFQFKVGYNLGPISLGVIYEDLFLDAGNHFSLDNDKLDFDTPLNSIKLEFAIGF